MTTTPDKNTHKLLVDWYNTKKAELAKSAEDLKAKHSLIASYIKTGELDESLLPIIADVNGMERLGAEFEKAIFENVEDLYEGEEDNEADTGWRDDVPDETEAEQAHDPRRIVVEGDVWETKKRRDQFTILNANYGGDVTVQWHATAQTAVKTLFAILAGAVLIKPSPLRKEKQDVTRQDEQPDKKGSELGRDHSGDRGDDLDGKSGDLCGDADRDEEANGTDFSDEQPTAVDGDSDPDDGVDGGEEKLGHQQFQVGDVVRTPKGWNGHLIKDHSHGSTSEWFVEDRHGDAYSMLAEELTLVHRTNIPKPEGKGWKRNTGVRPKGEIEDVVLTNGVHAKDWRPALFTCWDYGSHQPNDIAWYLEKENEEAEEEGSARAVRGDAEETAGNEKRADANILSPERVRGLEEDQRTTSELSDNSAPADDEENLSPESAALATGVTVNDCKNIEQAEGEESGSNEADTTPPSECAHTVDNRTIGSDPAGERDEGIQQMVEEANSNNGVSVDPLFIRKSTQTAEGSNPEDVIQDVLQSQAVEEA